MCQLKRAWASTARMTSGSWTSPMWWSRRARSLETSGSSSCAASGARCNSSSTRSVPARVAAATAAMPVRTRSSNGLRKSSAWAGSDSRVWCRRASACQRSAGRNKRSRPRKLNECSIQTEPLRTARRKANRVATSNARKARSRSAPLTASSQGCPRRGAVTSSGKRRSPLAYRSRSLPKASITGCSPMACQGSFAMATSDARTGLTASISRCLIADDRLGMR